MSGIQPRASGSSLNGYGAMPKKEDPDDERDELFLDSDSDAYSEGEQSDVSAGLGVASTSPTKRTKKRKGKVMDFGKRLKPSRTLVYTCAVLARDIKRGNIDLEAEYQRDVVWPEYKQSSLIDSILRHYHLPQILFSCRKVTMPDGSVKEIKICVDGKQRLTSIYNFMNNNIPLKDPGSKPSRKFWYSRDPTGKGLVVDEDMKEDFDSAQINCVEFEALTDEEERDIFQRVQMGTILSPAEKLQARTGAWPDLFRELSKRFCGNDGLAKLRDLSRGRDWMLMAVSALLIYNAGKQGLLPTASAIGLFIDRHENDPPSESFRKELLAVFQSFYAWSNDEAFGYAILPERVEGTKQLKTLSPMEFTFVAYMIWACEGASLEQMAELVNKMKKHVRSKHTDVMLNNKVLKTAQDWFEKQRIPGVNIKRSRNEAAAPAGSKRARAVDDEEYRPSPAAGAGGRGGARRRVEETSPVLQRGSIGGTPADDYSLWGTPLPTSQQNAGGGGAGAGADYYSANPFRR